jgi:hypothetical protein
MFIVVTSILCRCDNGDNMMYGVMRTIDVLYMPFKWCYYILVLCMKSMLIKLC